MTWTPPIIPKTTENPYTANTPTKADLDKRLGVLNDVIGRPIRHIIRRDSMGAYMLITPFSGGDHEVMNLGKTIPQAHRALCVAIDMYRALH